MFFAMFTDEHTSHKQIMIEVNDEIKKEKDPNAEEDEALDEDNPNKIVNSRQLHPVELLYKSYCIDKSESRIYTYFESLILLSAKICFDRNNKSIDALKYFYQLDNVIECVLNENLKDTLRSNFAELLISLHMDCDPLDTMPIPQMTRVFNQLT